MRTFDSGQYVEVLLVSQTWRDNMVKLSKDFRWRALFLPEGTAPGVGQVFRNPLLAKALELVANEPWNRCARVRLTLNPPEPELPAS